jgi:hypothetical protein
MSDEEAVELSISGGEGSSHDASKGKDEDLVSDQPSSEDSGPANEGKAKPEVEQTDEKKSDKGENPNAENPDAANTSAEAAAGGSKCCILL